MVTGTLASGAVRPGDTLEVLPGGAAGAGAQRPGARPAARGGRGRRAHVAPAHRRRAGGARARHAARRRPGRSRPPPACSAASPCCRTRRRRSAGFVPVRLHLYASEVLGRLRPLAAEGLAPGETGPVEIRLEAPVSAVRGDRYIVRRPSPPATLGGGEILDPRWRRHRGTILAAGARRRSRGTCAPRSLFWVQEAGERGVEAAELARRLGRAGRRGSRPSSAALARRSSCSRCPRSTATAGVDRARPPCSGSPSGPARVLKEYFQNDRLADAMPKAEAVRRILRGRAADLAPVYFGWLEAQKVLAVRGRPGDASPAAAPSSPARSRSSRRRCWSASTRPASRRPSPGELAAGARRQAADPRRRRPPPGRPRPALAPAERPDPRRLRRRRPAPATCSPPPGSASRWRTSRTASA